MRHPRASVAVLVLAGGFLLVAACGGDSSSSTTTTSSTVASSTTTSSTSTPSTSTSTTAVPTSATPTTAASGTIPTDPQAYAEAFVDAWAHGNHGRAVILGTQAAVDKIFAYDSGGPGHWSLQHCEGAAGSSYCTFTAGGTPTIVVRVGNEAASQGAPQAVTEVQVTS